MIKGKCFESVQSHAEVYVLKACEAVTHVQTWASYSAVYHYSIVFPGTNPTPVCDFILVINLALSYTISKLLQISNIFAIWVYFSLTHC